MHITRLDLKHYKPLQFSDHTQLTMSLTAPVQIIVGDNGSGKSSVCRALTPFPPDSTEYSKDGYKIIELTHEGHRYVLTSDFRHGICHSFRRDDVELNDSGTQKTQTELAISEFGLTPTLTTLCANGLNICNTRPSERRNRLLELYPGDLSFINQHHKAVCSDLRNLSANIKMLRGTQAELEAQLLPVEELQRLRDQLKQYLDLASQADNEIFAISRETDTLERDPHYNHHIELDPKQLHNRCEELCAQLIEIQRRDPTLFTEDGPKLLESLHAAENDHLQTEQRRLDKEAAALAKRIAECEHVLDTSAKREAALLNTRIEALQERMSMLVLDPAVPLLNAEDFERFEQTTLPRLQFLLERISGKVWPVRGLMKARQRLEEWQRERQSVLWGIDETEHRVGELEQQLNTVVAISPKPGCDEACDLRHNFERMRQRSASFLEQTRKTALHQRENLHRLDARILRLQTAVSGIGSQEAVLRELEETFAWNHWGRFVLNGAPLFKVLNCNPTQIGNNLQRLLIAAKTQQQRETTQRELTETLLKVQALKNTSQPASDLISRTMLEQQIKLEQTLHDLKQAKTKLQSNDVKLQYLRQINSQVVELQKHHGQLHIYVNSQIVQTKVKVRKIQIERLQQAKRRLLLQIGTLEQTINTQEHLKSRLYEGTLPQLHQLLTKQQTLMHLEMALSPNSGLPHCYLVRFLNTVIRNVNRIISSIWSYDLEILPVDETKPLTFDFPVAINRSGRIPDISICSDGQKEIINLAWTIALAEINGALQRYPLKLDEPDKGISHGNRGRVLELLSRLIQQQAIKQLVLINHHDGLYSAFPHCEVLCLSADNITVPAVFNQHVELK